MQRINIDVNLASQTHQVPQVGFPQSDPVTIEIIEKINPIGARLYAKRDKNLIFSSKLIIEAIPKKAKQAKANKDAGT